MRCRQILRLNIFIRQFFEMAKLLKTKVRVKRFLFCIHVYDFKQNKYLQKSN